MEQSLAISQNLKTELEKLSKTIVRQKINDIKTYLKVKISGIDDDENYKKAKSLLKDVNSELKKLDVVHKELKSDALNYGRAIDNGKNLIRNEVVPVKEYLKGIIAEIDDEKKAIREKELYNAEIESCWDDAQAAHIQFIKDQIKLQELADEKTRLEKERGDLEKKKNEERIREDERLRMRQSVDPVTHQSFTTGQAVEPPIDLKKDESSASDIDRIKAYLRSVGDPLPPVVKNERATTLLTAFREAVRMQANDVYLEIKAIQINCFHDFN